MADDTDETARLAAIQAQEEYIKRHEARIADLKRDLKYEREQMAEAIYQLRKLATPGEDEPLLEGVA